MPRSKSEAEALERLRERLQATHDAAQRMAEEARAAIDTDPDRPPAAGWDVPRAADETSSELEMLMTLLATLRDVLPPELRAQLAELVKALLVFVRTALDFAISQLELAATPGEEPEVEDIPIA